MSPSREGPHTALAAPGWQGTLGCSAGLEKRKSAKEKAAQQSEGTQPLGAVGTVPAAVSEQLCLSSSSPAGAGLAKGPPLRQQGLLFSSLDSHR